MDGYGAVWAVVFAMLGCSVLAGCCSVASHEPHDSGRPGIVSVDRIWDHAHWLETGALRSMTPEPTQGGLDGRTNIFLARIRLPQGSGRGR